MSSNDDAEREKKKEQLKAYVSAREVFSSSQYSILVDSFRFVRPYYNLLEERRNNQHRGASEQADCLHEGNSNTVAPTVIFFLSHFHSDHYTGITPSWWHGRIFCSLPTAALVTSVLQVPPGLVYPLSFGTWYVFSLTRCRSSTTTSCDASAVICMEEDAFHTLREEDKLSYDVLFKVRLLDANHCPGAAMFLFCSDAFGCILHTGDFRYNCVDEERTARHLFSDRPDFAPFYAPRHLLTEMAAIHATGRKEGEAILRDKLHAPFYEQFLDTPLLLYRNKINVLFLDNTFCQPAFHFPKQWEVTQHVVGTLRAVFLEEGERKKRTAAAAEELGPTCVKVALIVGTYAIGKERVAFAVQEAFDVDVDTAQHRPCEKVPIYVSEKKMSLYEGMQFHADRFRPVRASRVRAGSDGARGATTPSDIDLQEAAQLEAFPVRLPYLASEVMAAMPGCAPASTHASGPTVSRSLTYEDGRDDASSASPLYELSILLVPMSSISYPTLAEAVGRPLKRRRSTGDHSPGTEQGTPLLPLDDGIGVDLSSYDRILAVEPTGWSKKCKVSRIPPRVDLLSIPYSEHSSFDELLHFVEFLNPSKVVPTVSVEQYAEHESLFVERAPKLKCRFGNTQPICNFFTAQAAKQLPLDGVKKEKQEPKDERAEDAVHALVSSTASASANNTNSENKPPVSTRRPPEKKKSAATAQPLTNYFKKASCAQNAHPGLSVKLKREEEDAMILDVDDAECLYVGCGYEVTEISDDD